MMGKLTAVRATIPFILLALWSSPLVFAADGPGAEVSVSIEKPIATTIEKPAAIEKSEQHKRDHRAEFEKGQNIAREILARDYDKSHEHDYEVHAEALWLPWFTLALISIGMIFLTRRFGKAKGKTFSWNFGAKLTASYGVILVCVSLMFVYTLLSVHQVTLEVDDVADNTLPLTKMVTALTLHQLEQAIQLERAFRYGEINEPKAKELFKKSKAQFKKLAHKVDQEFVEIEERLQELVPHSEGVKLELEKALQKTYKLDSMHRTFEELAFAAIKELEAGNIYKAHAIEEAVVELEDELDHKLEAFVLALEENMDVTLKLIKKHEHSTEQVTMFLGLLVSTVGFLFAVWMSKILTAPIVEVIAGLRDSSSQTWSTGERLRDAAETVSEESNKQAAAVQESVASMNQIASMLSLTNDNAQKAGDLVSSVTEKTDSGSRTMEQMVSSMESIQQANHLLQDIHQIMSEISSQTTVINDIVFKTQLLAFNAAIEAARAGQHGRGFAVVAEEVGSLAELSGNAAQEIEALLENSQKQVAQIVELTASRVKEGEEISRQALSSFTEIAKDVRDISTEIQGIANATREQNEGVDQTVTAMTHMDKATQQNNQVAKNALTYSHDLRQQSEQLSSKVTMLQKVIFGEAMLSGSILMSNGNSSSESTHAVWSGESLPMNEETLENFTAYTPEKDQAGDWDFEEQPSVDWDNLTERS